MATMNAATYDSKNFENPQKRLQLKKMMATRAHVRNAKEKDALCLMSRANDGNC